MKITKGLAFTITTGVIFGVFLTAVIVSYTKAEPVSFIGETLGALVAVATAYIAGNVADNGVKGKFYQQGLDKSEDK